MKTLMMIAVLLVSTMLQAQFTCGDQVQYAGQTYNTVQIGTQCWFKENLNVGTMIPGGQMQTNNGVIEKHCYNNIEATCALYGGLYQWDEMMQYATSEKGICPSGWHVPDITEWTDLFDLYGGRALAGGKLSSPDGWKPVSNYPSSVNYYYTVRCPECKHTNESGLTLLPNGYNVLGRFGGLTVNSYTWTSTKVIDNYFHPTFGSDGQDYPVVFSTYNTLAGVGGDTQQKYHSYGVRCVKD